MKKLIIKDLTLPSLSSAKEREMYPLLTRLFINNRIRLRKRRKRG